MRDEKIGPTRVGEIGEIGVPRGVAADKREAAGENFGAIGGVRGDFADAEISEDGIADAMGGGEVDGGVGVHDGQRVRDEWGGRNAGRVVDVERERFRLHRRSGGGGRGVDQRVKKSAAREGENHRDRGTHGGPAHPAWINSPSPVSTETSARKPRAAAACSGAPSE